jgi:hypothetical protein
MSTPTSGMIRCKTCGTTFPAENAAEVADHSGHDLQHVEQA